MNYKYNRKKHTNNLYMCDYSKASKLIALLNLEEVAKNNTLFSIELMNTTIILYKFF